MGDSALYRVGGADSAASRAGALAALANSAVVKAVTLSKSPLAYWRLNDVGNVAKDSSGNRFDATIQGYADLVKAKGSNLVGYWRLEETTGTVAADSSGFGRNGTMAGATLGQTGPLLDPDLAYNFPDAAGVATVNAPFNFTAAFTIEMLLQTSRPIEGYRGICGEYNGTQTGYDLGIQNGALRMTLRGTTNIDTGANAATIVNDGLWHHVAIVVTSTAQILIYIDGTLKQTTNGTWTPITNTAAFCFGRRQSTDGAGQCFIGALDEVALYNVGLTATEVAQHYNAALVTRMVARGAAALTPGDPNDAAMTFVNVPAAIVQANGIGLGSTGQLTLAAWIELPVLTAQVCIVGSRQDNNTIGVFLNANGSLQFRTTGGGVISDLSSGAGVATAGKVGHVACTYDGTTKTIYFNGAVVATRAGDHWANPDGNLTIGGRGAGFSLNFGGTIDDVSVYNRALSPADISDLYLAGKNALAAHVGAKDFAL